MEFSNKALVVLLLAAMVISLGGTLISINRMNQVTYVGYATTATGTVDIDIQPTTSITSADNDAIDFAECTPDEGIGVVSNVTSDKLEQTSICGTFFAGATDNITIRNDGNTNATVTLAVDACAPGSGNTSCTFLDSPSEDALFMYKTMMGGTGATYTNGCVAGLLGTYTSFGGTHGGYAGCGKLLTGLINNSFITHYKVGVPSDAPIGAVQVTITYSAAINSS